MEQSAGTDVSLSLSSVVSVARRPLLYSSASGLALWQRTKGTNVASAFHVISAHAHMYDVHPPDDTYIQVNEKSFDLKEGWYKKEGDKTGMNGCMLPW